MWTWLALSLLCTVDLASDLLFAVEIHDLQSGCVHGSPHGLTINFDNGTDTCSNLNLFAGGACPEAEENMAAYCGYTSVCGYDDLSGTCYVNTQCKQVCSEMQKQRQGCVEDSCSPRFSPAISFMKAIVVILVFTGVKEVMRTLGTMNLLLGKSLSSDNSLGATSALSVLLIFFQSDKLSEYNDFVLGKDDTLRSTYMLSFVMDLLLEDVPQIVLAGVFVYQWGFLFLPAATVSLVLSTSKVLFVLRLKQLRSSHHGKPPSTGPATVSPLAKPVSIRTTSI